MKMSDVFQLPVEPDSDNDIKVGDWGFLLASEDVTSEQAKAAAHAINCHDGLVEALRDALNMLISIYDDDEIRIAAKKHVTLEKMQPLSDALKNSKVDGDA